jgi:hypothetical protein
MQGAAMLGRGTLDIKKVRKATIHAMLTSDQIKKYAV